MRGREGEGEKVGEKSLMNLGKYHLSESAVLVAAWRSHTRAHTQTHTHTFKVIYLEN